MRAAFKIKSELIPPRGSIPQGAHTDGRVIYLLKNRLDPRMTKKEPVIGPDGKPMYKKHPTTGEAQYPIMRAVAVYRDFRFVLDRNGRGQVSLQENFEPSKEELKKMQEARDRDVFAEDLAQEAVNRGLSASDVLDLLAGGKKVPSGPPPDVQYPWDRKGGHWLLSDGSKFRGSRVAAEEAEAALDENVMPPPQPEPDDIAADILEGVEVTIPTAEILAGAAAKVKGFDSQPMPPRSEE